MKSFILRSSCFLVSCVLILVAFCEVCPKPKAYATNGYRWNTNTVKYFYDNFNSDRGKTFLRKGIKSWNDRTDDVTIVAGNSGNYDIYCGETSQINAGWDGISLYETSGSYFTGVTVLLNTQSDWTWMDDGALLSVSVHEFGHALGLGHTQGAVIMNPYTWGENSRYEAYNLTTPQIDDLYGINALY